MALTAANGTSASMWAGRRDDPTSTNWGGSREPGSAFRGTATRGRGRGGGRTRAGGRGGRPPSDRSGLEGGGESQRLSNTAGKPTTSNNVVRIRQPGSSVPSNSPEKTPSTRVSSSALGSRRGDTGDKNPRSDMNGLKDLPSQGGPRSATFKASATSLQSTPSTTSTSSSKSSSRRRRSAGSRKSSISVKNPKQLTSSLAPPVPSFPNAVARDTLLPSASLEPISPMHDIRQDVDSLVDHVRTMAMEGNRASSPATHIDWAGDEDDSLPDLEDWGISSSKVVDVNRHTTNVDDLASTEPPKPTAASDVDKAEEVILSSSVGSMVGASETRGSTSSPTESSAPMESVPLINASPRTRGDRKRDRGRGKDKEKKTMQSTPFPPSNSGNVTSSITSPKKTLLERLSSPTRPEPISVPKRSEKSPLRTFNGIGESRSPVSTLPYHPSLPPKPISSPFADSSARRANGTNLTSKPSSPRRQRHEEVKMNVQPVDGNSTEPSVTAQPIASATPETTKNLLTEKPTTEGPKIIENKEKEDLTPPDPKSPSLDNSKDAAFLTSTSFDWSEEPTPFEPIFSQPSVKLDIEPPTPLEEPVSSPANTHTVSSGFPSTRSRAQRPLSGDITPRVRRERSPHKTHNTRNHSAPSPGGMGGARTRPPHASRPIIRMDALAMISRSLRESPTPPRRESPAPTAISATE